MEDRLVRLRNLLRQNRDKYDSFFVTRPENRAYLSGFTGSSGYLLVTESDNILFTDGRYTEQAAAQAKGWNIVRLFRPYEESVINELKKLKVARIAFEADHMTHAEYLLWSEGIKESLWVPTFGDVSNLRRRKDAAEVELIRKAVDIADSAFEHILGYIKPGITERDVAIELEFAMRRQGADRNAFDTIVASGWRAALPHGRASEKVIEKGDFVTIDFGAHYQGYNSDITRTVIVGTPTDRQREVYSLVLEAQLGGVAAVKAGAICKEVDEVSRSIFREAGQVDFYLHGLGHNLGREVHESPFIGPTDSTPLESGMVLTIEPGLYYSEWGGVRIEDDLLVTDSGAEILSRSPKELISL